MSNRCDWTLEAKISYTSKSQIHLIGKHFKVCLLIVINKTRITRFNPRTYTQSAKSYLHRGIKGWGVDGSPPCVFLYIAVFRNDFAFRRKPLIFFTSIFYWWCRCWRSVTSINMVAILDLRSGEAWEFKLAVLRCSADRPHTLTNRCTY